MRDRRPSTTADERPAQRGPTRRGLLAAAGTGAASLVLGGPLARPAAAAGLPASPRFDLTRPSRDVFPTRNHPLHESSRTMQSLTYDSANQRLFVAQLQSGTSGDDLCISQLDADGRLLGWMYLDGVGHGVSIGVDAVGRDSYLWTEALSNRTDDRGRGTALQRFRWVSGTRPSGARIYLRGSTDITCSTDPVNRRLMVHRRLSSGAYELTVHPLASAIAGDFSAPLVRALQPALSGVFQGHALYGRYAYFLTGSGHADASDIDSRLTSFDLARGSVVQRGVLDRVASSMVWREPEGVAVHRTPTGQVRLVFGLAARDSLYGSMRYANLFAKDTLVG